MMELLDGRISSSSDHEDLVERERAKSKPFSSYETELLLDLVNRRKSIIESKKPTLGPLIQKRRNG